MQLLTEHRPQKNQPFSTPRRFLKHHVTAKRAEYDPNTPKVTQVVVIMMWWSGHILTHILANILELIG